MIITLVCIFISVVLAEFGVMLLVIKRATQIAQVGALIVDEWKTMRRNPHVGSNHLSHLIEEMECLI